MSSDEKQRRLEERRAARKLAKQKLALSDALVAGSPVTWWERSFYESRYVAAANGLCQMVLRGAGRPYFSDYKMQIGG